MATSTAAARGLATASATRLAGSRLGGFAGLAFALSVVFQNGVLLLGAPTPSAPLADVEAFYTERAAFVTAAVALVAVNLVLLLVFVASVRQRFAAVDGAKVWGDVALASVVLVGGLFSVATLLQAVLVATMPTLAADPATLRLAWDLHSAAFAVVGSALGALVGALALGARSVPIVPRWGTYVGLGAAAFCIAGSAGAVGTIQGGPALWLMMVGFVGWIAFLATASIRMIRGIA